MIRITISRVAVPQGRPKIAQRFIAGSPVKRKDGVPSGTEGETPMHLRYIQSQKEHHQVHSFKDEFIAFLERHGIEYESWMLD